MDSPQKTTTLHRRSHRKSRRGCVTCKIRRVKCDEMRPDCYRCTSTGRRCDGYLTPNDNADSLHKSDNNIVKPLLQLPTQAWPPQQRQAFDFYMTTTSHVLCGSTSSEKDFWSQTLPQIAMAETAIQHGLCALGALHRHAIKRKLEYAPDFTDAPMKQYSLAVSAMAVGSEKYATTPAIPILSCLLFAIFENFQGYHDYALLHVKHGSRILRAAIDQQSLAYLSEQSQGTRTSRDLFNHVKRIFLRFARQIKELGRELPTGRTSTKDEAWVSLSFEDIDQASRALEDIYLESVEKLAFKRGRNMIPRAVREQSLKKVKAWCDAFDSLPIGVDAEENIHKAGPPTLALLVYRRLFTTIVGTSNITQETDFDIFLPEFQEIVAFADRLVNEGIDLKSNTASKVPKFVVSSCPVAPVLYLICWKCRDPWIRRKALELLIDMDTHDGLWDSNILAAYASSIIETEEERATSTAGHGTGHVVNKASDIPEGARLGLGKSLGQFLSRPLMHEELIFHKREEIYEAVEVDEI